MTERNMQFKAHPARSHADPIPPDLRQAADLLEENDLVSATEFTGAIPAIPPVPDDECSGDPRLNRSPDRARVRSQGNIR